MTIHIPKPLALLLLVVFVGAPLAFLAQEIPDLIRYLKQEEGL